MPLDFLCLWCFAKISIFSGYIQKMAFFCVRFWCSKRGPKERRHTMHLHSFGPLFRRRKWTHFLPRPFVQRWLFWSLGSSHPGVVPHNSAHPWRTMYGFPRAPSPAHCHAKAALGGVQNRRAVIAAVALDRPPPRRGAVRLRRGGMRAARGAAPKTPR